MPRGSEHSEDRLIGWLRRRWDGRDGELPLIGDDAALLDLGGDWAITVDSQIAGVHYPADLDPAWVARRLLAVNLSDLAAVGAAPAFAFLALSAPQGFDARRFLSALARAARSFGIRLAGGDLARNPERTTATLTLLGRRPRGGKWLRRSNAYAGDRLWLGGTIGESALGQLLLAYGARPRTQRSIEIPAALDLSPALIGAARRAVLRHLAPEPQLALGTALGRLPRAAAIDVSDGLARDLHRLCRESAVGAEINAGALPLPNRFAALAAALGKNPLEIAFGGGEDYVLLFALPEDITPPEGFTCREIGRIVAGRSIRSLRAGRAEALPALGWDHLASDHK